MTKEDTQPPNPARYLSGYGPRQIEVVETTTVRGPDLRESADAADFKVEYVRDVNGPIGWDEGEDATFSFVECSGGDSSRNFHGRPMWAGNRKLRGFGRK